MNQKDWKGQKCFDERRVLRLEAKVSFGKVRIACGEMHRLIVGWRTATDEENALDKKQKQKEE
jgi:hypothetical protein